MRPRSRSPIRSNGEPAVALSLDERVRPTIPHLDRARAVLPGGDHALEGTVGERVVLDVHREVAGAGIERDPLRHGPAAQDALLLEPEVVVQSPRSMALHHERAERADGRRSAERLGRPARDPLRRRYSAVLRSSPASAPDDPLIFTRASQWP